ncbi:MAG TPA: signal peptidase II [Candidatus Aminicenantes bacterium]|nr:signal peptidase II [Candidatus Aminicenantes bacterium]
MKKENRPYLFLVIILFSLDQLSKYLIQKYIGLYGQVKVIPGFFNLTHLHNRGAIFGFFAHTHNPVAKIVLPVASLLALGFVIFYFIRTPAQEKTLKLALSLILAGALGNLVDRLGRGYVVDFLDFYYQRFHWPNFNVADSCISVGAIILFLTILIKSKGKEKKENVSGAS